MSTNHRHGEAVIVLITLRGCDFLPSRLVPTSPRDLVFLPRPVSVVRFASQKQARIGSSYAYALIRCHFDHQSPHLFVFDCSPGLFHPEPSCTQDIVDHCVPQGNHSYFLKPSNSHLVEASVTR